MTVEGAIKKAIDGGYSYLDLPLIDVRATTGACIELIWTGDQFSKNGQEHDLVWPECIFLDPHFWQSLGKAMGWKEAGKHTMNFEKSRLRCIWCGRKPAVDPNCTQYMDEWKYRWHRLIDHVADGKTVKEFFSELK